MFIQKRVIMPRRKAFTLIELLVVIAIISIIASILFPVFARAREQARKASCQSNLKQIGAAVMMYVQDFDEKYPMGRMYDTVYFYRLLEPYVKSNQVWVCPTAGEVTSPSGRFGSGGYAWNICGMDTTGSIGNGFGYTWATPCTPNGAIGVSLAQVPEPAQTILSGDPASSGYQGNGYYLWARQQKLLPVLHGGQVGPFYNTASTTVAGEPKSYVGGGNYLYADGHVKFMMNTQAWANRQKLFNITRD